MNGVKPHQRPCVNHQVTCMTLVIGEHGCGPWTGELLDVAFEFIGLQMILDYNRAGDEARKTPVLDPNTSKVGISNKPHPKTKNLIQILYVKSTVNVMM